MYRLLILILIIPSLIFSDSFNQYRKDRFKTGRTTLTVVGNPSIIWKYSLGSVHRYTVCTDEQGNVYSFKDGGVISLNNSGEKRWETSIDATWYKSCPCLTSDSLCIVHSHSNGKLFALNMNNGQVAWNLAIPVYHEYQWFTPLLGKDDKIYVEAGQSSKLYCVSTAGSIEWTANNVNCLYHFTIAADSLLLTQRGYYIYAYYLNNGDLLGYWHQASYSGYPTGDPDKLVFYSHYTDGIRAIDLEGNLAWDARYFEGGTNNGPILGHNGRIYAPTFTGLYAVDIETGTIYWKLSMKVGTESFGAVDGNGKIILVQDLETRSAVVFVTDHGTSASFIPVELETETESSIAIGYPGFVYVCGLDGYLYCIGDKTGFSDNKKTSSLPSPSLSISPNPFSNRLSLSLPSSASIYSLTGQMIMKLDKGKHSIDTSKWKQGVYIVKSGKETKRIVKIN